jgi:hypothetical protein
MRSYALETLATDFAAVGIFAVSFKTDAVLPLIGVSLGTYTLGAPLIHGAHGHADKGLADFGLRIGAPLALGAIGYGLGSTVGCNPNSFCSTGLNELAIGTVGVFGGIVTASIVDAAVLAREPVPVDESSSNVSVEWSPVVGFTSRGDPTVGIAGRF